MLRPQDTSTRERKSLNGLLQFTLFADFTTTSGIMRVGGKKKGAFTRDRQPKAAAHALRRRWREGL